MFNQFGCFYPAPVYFYEMPVYPISTMGPYLPAPIEQVIPRQTVAQQPANTPPTQESETSEAEPSDSGSSKRNKSCDSDYKFKVQDTKRNTFSNIVRHMFIFIRNRKASLKLVQQIIAKHRLSLSPQQFYAFLAGIRLNSYIRSKAIKELWSGRNTGAKNKLRVEQSKLLRILSYQYLGKHAHLAVQLAKKIRREFKTDHHKKVHEIRQYLRGLYIG